MSDFTAKITAILDSRQAESQLNALKSAKHQLDIQVNLKSGNTNINNFLNGLKNQAQSAGASAGSGFADSFNSGLNRINVNNGMSAIANMQRTLKSMKFDHSSIDTLTRDLDKMNLSIQSVSTRMNGNNLDITVRGVDEMGRAVTVVKQFDSESGRISTASKRITQSFNEISTASQKMASSAQITKFDAQITTWLNNNTKANNTYRSSVEELQQRLHSLASSGQVPISTLRELQQQMGAFSAQAKAAGVAAAIWIYGGKKSGWGNDPERKQRLTAKFGASNAAAIQSYINAHANNGDLYNYWVSTGKSNLSKYYYNAFKKGARRVISAQDAWTQEAGQELIVRPSDNALLTSMKPGDSVLTAKMTENIWKMAQNPEEFIGNHGVISIADMIPNGATIPSASNDVTFGDIVISIDHVDDYNDFMNKLKTDRTFEKMIQSMTVDRMVGGSKLAKYKYNWK